MFLAVKKPTSGTSKLPKKKKKKGSGAASLFNLRSLGAFSQEFNSSILLQRCPVISLQHGAHACRWFLNTNAQKKTRLLNDGSARKRRVDPPGPPGPSGPSSCQPAGLNQDECFHRTGTQGCFIHANVLYNEKLCVCVCESTETPDSDIMTDADECLQSGQITTLLLPVSENK